MCFFFGPPEPDYRVKATLYFKTDNSVKFIPMLFVFLATFWRAYRARLGSVRY